MVKSPIKMRSYSQFHIIQNLLTLHKSNLKGPTNYVFLILFKSTVNVFLVDLLT